MSDDFDDDEAQHRLVIDDHLDSGDNMQTSKNSDGLQFDATENDLLDNNVLSVKQDNSRRSLSRSCEAMDSSECLPLKAEAPDQALSDLGNENQQNDSLIKSKVVLIVDGTKSTSSAGKKHQLVDSDTESSNKYGDKIKNFLSPATKKKRMIDKSTCVHTKACQFDENLNLLSLKAGTTACINITIVCKAGGNTLFFIAKWKGREYHGVLSDGEHPMEHVYSQKRNVAGDKNIALFNNISETSTQNTVGGGKARGKRGGRMGVEKKNRVNGTNECEDLSEVGNKTNEELHSSELCEFSDKGFVRCVHRQCGYRFESLGDVNTHMLMSHVTSKAVMTESVSTQTLPIDKTSCGTENCAADFSAAEVAENCETGEKQKDALPVMCLKCKQAITSADKTNEISLQEQDKSLEDLFKVVRSTCISEKKCDIAAKDGNSPGAFSDISDDGAPTLEKEESYDKLAEGLGSGVSKKVPINEPINILAPVVAGPALDILSPVLSSSSAATTTAGLQTEHSDSAHKPTSFKSNLTSLKSLSPIGLDIRKIDGASTLQSGSKSVQDNFLQQQQHTFQQMLPTSSSAVSSSSPAATSAASKMSLTSNSLVAQQAAAAAHLMQAVAAGGLGTAPLPGAASQILGSTGTVPPHMYMTPFQPNFFNSPFLSMANLSPSQAVQISGLSSGNVNGTNHKLFSAANYPSSSSSAFNTSTAGNAVAANGLSPVPSSTVPASSTNFSTTQKLADQSLLTAQQQMRHKIYELKASSHRSSPSTSSTANCANPSDRMELGNTAAASGGGRSSAAVLNAGNADAPSPLRPSSAIPSSRGGNFMRQPAHSPNTSAMAATQFLNAAAASGMIPPNIASSPAMANLGQHHAAVLNQQQQIQQLNHLRNLGIPVPSFLPPDQLAQYAALLSAAAPQMVSNGLPQAQQQAQQQFPHPSQKQ